jgi:4-amino-4-deoxy-L-arabinose transferase-like glycosyltransferase
MPWTMDEPMFIAAARHILIDPLHPYAFDFNWYGRLSPMVSIATNPPGFAYVLALAWKLGGGREWAVRLALLPLDLLAAFALFGLASRRLRRPLWPTLAVLAAPAWALDVSHAMAEKLAVALGFAAMYAGLRAIDEDEDRWFWGAAALFAGAMLAKLAAAFLLFPVFFYALRKGVPWRKVALFVVAAGLPLGIYLLVQTFQGGGFAAIGHAVASVDQAGYAGPLERLRAILAFTGGCALAPAVWSLAGLRGRPWPLALGAVAGFLILRSSATGVLFCAVAFCVLAAAFRSDDAFLRDWAIAGLLLLVLYGAVAARTTVFMLPALTFAAARELESRWSPRSTGIVIGLSAGALAALTLALSAVDARYCRAQREVADYVAHAYAGRTIWCDSHWGLQFYMTELGARQLDWTRGGWQEVKPGDVVVYSRVNTNVLWPEKRVDAQMQKLTVGSPIPLRLMSGWGGQAGFYCNKNGFLPFSFSREPLDEFVIAQVASTR